MFAVINIPIFDIRTTKFSNGRFQHDFDFVTLCKFFEKFDNGPESVLVTNQLFIISDACNCAC